MWNWEFISISQVCRIRNFIHGMLIRRPSILFQLAKESTTPQQTISLPGNSEKLIQLEKFRARSALAARIDQNPKSPGRRRRAPREQIRDSKSPSNGSARAQYNAELNFLTSPRHHQADPGLPDENCFLASRRRCRRRRRNSGGHLD